MASLADRGSRECGRCGERVGERQSMLTQVSMDVIRTVGLWFDGRDRSLGSGVPSHVYRARTEARHAIHVAP